MNYQYHQQNGAVAGQPGSAAGQGYGVHNFGAYSHVALPTATTASSSGLLSAATTGNPMASAPAAIPGAVGNTTATHSSIQMATMPPLTTGSQLPVQQFAQQMLMYPPRTAYPYQPQQQQQQPLLTLQQQHQLAQQLLTDPNMLQPVNRLQRSLTNPALRQLSSGMFVQDPASAAQPQSGQDWLSRMAAMAPSAPVQSDASFPLGTANYPASGQQQQLQPNYTFLAQQQQQQLQQLQQQQYQQLSQSALHEQAIRPGAPSVSLDSSLAMPPPPPPKLALEQSAIPPARLSAPSLATHLANTSRQPTKLHMQTPQLTRNGMHTPAPAPAPVLASSQSTSSTAASTPPFAAAVSSGNVQQAPVSGAGATLKRSRQSIEPDQTYSPAAVYGGAPQRLDSESSTSPALSTATKQSKSSPKPAKKGSAKETKRKTGTQPAKKNTVTAAADSADANGKPKANFSGGTKRPRTKQTPIHDESRSIDTEPATPLVASMALPATSTAMQPHTLSVPIVLARQPLAATMGDAPVAPENIGTWTHTAATSIAAPRQPPRATTSSQAGLQGQAASDLPLVPMQGAGHLAPVAMSQKEILGRGIEQLLKFHSALAPITEAGEIDYWRAKVSDSFSDIGIIRLELGSQTYNMPVAAAGSFYHLLFGEDCGVVSMHVALGQPRVYPLRQTASIMSFHGVQMTTTYSNGRRVLETGDLRVIFDESFRIRLWAFSSDDATVCLPRKRPNASDDSLTRTSEATIARNLDWPNLSPAPKRRKSANGKQPPEECALPAVALQRLEIVNTMYNLQDLVVLQLQDKNTSMGIMELWMKTVNPKPLPPSKQPTKQLSGPERKRPRKKSTAAMQPPPPATASAGPTNTAELVSANDAKSRFATITPSPSVAAKPARQPLKH